MRVAHVRGLASNRRHIGRVVRHQSAMVFAGLSVVHSCWRLASRGSPAGAVPTQDRPQAVHRECAPSSGPLIGGRVAPGAGAGGARSAHAMPVLRPAD